MPIFIVGCGRSGTHWLGKIITKCSKIAGTVTDVTTKKQTRILRIRSLCEQGIYYPDKLDAVLPKIQRHYKKYIRSHSPKIYADKTHGELWIVDSLATMFPGAKFIGIERGVFPVVASLVNRNSAMSTRRAGNAWKRYPIPTGPSGITAGIAKIYSRFDIFERAALVWLAHKEKMRWAKRRLGKKLLVLNYEDMLMNFRSNVSSLSRFLGGKIPIDKEILPRSTENNKWKLEIPNKSVKKIYKMLEDKDIRAAMKQTTTIHARTEDQLRRILG